MNNKAVILGANYYIALGIIRSLGKKGIHTVAIEYQTQGAYGLKSKYLKEEQIAPHYKKDTEGFINFLIDYGKSQREKPVLFPCADPYVEVIDAHLDLLKEYYLIAQQEQGLFTKLMDKNSLQDIAIAHQVKIPETLQSNDVNLLERTRNEIGYPCIVKPSDSSSFVSTFRRKMFLVEKESELLEAIEKANKNNLEVFVQRIIPGFDDHMYTFDCYLNQDSKVTHYMTCNKKRQYPINFGASVYTSQEHVPELYDIGKPFLEAVGFKGFAEIEFKKDANTGEFYLIEINVRTTNFNAMLEKTGIDFPFVQYAELVGQEIGSNHFTKTTKRTFVYGLEDFLAIKGYLKTKQITLADLLKVAFRKKTYAIWSIDDPKPYFYYMGILFSKAAKKIFKRT